MSTIGRSKWQRVEQRCLYYVVNTCKQLLYAQVIYIVFNNEQHFLAAANVFYFQLEINDTFSFEPVLLLFYQLIDG